MLNLCSAWNHHQQHQIRWSKKERSTEMSINCAISSFGVMPSNRSNLIFFTHEHLLFKEQPFIWSHCILLAPGQAHRANIFIPLHRKTTEPQESHLTWPRPRTLRWYYRCSSPGHKSKLKKSRRILYTEIWRHRNAVPGMRQVAWDSQAGLGILPSNVKNVTEHQHQTRPLSVHDGSSKNTTTP